MCIRDSIGSLQHIASLLLCYGNQESSVFLAAVSYTHLDVYKRQILFVCCYDIEYDQLIELELLQLDRVALVASV